MINLEIIPSFIEERDKNSKFVSFSYLVNHRRVIPIIGNDIDYTSGLAMIIDLSSYLKKDKFMNIFSKKSEIAPEIVISFKFSNPPITSNKYELSQFIRLSFSSFSRESKKRKFSPLFPIYKSDLELIPRSQWFKYLDDDIRDNFESDLEDSEKYNFKEDYGKIFTEDLDTVGLYEGANWVLKKDNKFKVIIVSIDREDEKIVFKDLKGKTYKLSINKFIVDFRLILREGVKKKTKEVMLVQTSDFVNNKITNVLKKVFQEYRRRYDLYLSEEYEIINLIDLGGTSLDKFKTVGEFAAFNAEKIVDKALMRSKK